MRTECARVRHLLALRDDDWSAQERQQVQLHTETCPDCAVLAQVYAGQDRLIRAAPRVRLTALQRDQLHSRVRREGRRRTMYARLVTVVGTAAAAAALIALGVGLFVLFRGQEQPTVSSSGGASIVSKQDESTATEPALGAETAAQPPSLLFADEIRVYGFNIQSPSSTPAGFAQEGFDPDESLMLEGLLLPAEFGLTLDWQVVTPPRIDWRVYVHVINAAGDLVLQNDVDVDWPAVSCGEGERDSPCTVTTQHEWVIPADFQPGAYAITFGLYDPITGERAPVTDPDGVTTPVNLGHIVIPEPQVFADEIRNLDVMTLFPSAARAQDRAAPSLLGGIDVPAEVGFVLRWQVVASPSADWRVFVHVLDEAGQLTLQSDVEVEWPQQPCPEEALGPECTITTTHQWTLPEDFSPGLYTVVTGLYDPASGERAPVTNPAGALAQSIELGHVWVLSESSGAERPVVTLRVFSGRPNPMWTLAPDQETELRQRLQSLAETDLPYDVGGRLGYSGFSLLLPAAGGDGSQSVIVWNGVVQVESHDRVAKLADEDRALERWLFDQAANHIDTATFNIVRREFWAEPPLIPLTPTPALRTDIPGGFAIFLAAEDVSPASLFETDLKAIVLQDEPILSAEDILRYSADRHEIILTPSAQERIRQLSVPTSGRAFVVVVGSERIYSGAFWTPASSLSFDGLVIQVPPLDDALRIQLGYPQSPELFRGQDRRSDPRVLESLRQAGKLQ